MENLTSAARVTLDKLFDKMAVRKSVSELQAFLKERGVIISGQRKLELVELCNIAQEIHLEIDPDGLIEDRSEVIAHKLFENQNQWHAWR